MKKILLVVILGMALMATKAQQATTFPLAAGDTIVNTATASKTLKLTGGYSGAAIQAIVTKQSGTGAGTIVVQGSNDNVTFTTIGGTYTITNTTTQATMFYVTAPVPVYLKILATGSGTVAELVTVNYVLRKYDRN